MTALDALNRALHEDIQARGLGALYSLGELVGRAAKGGASVEPTQLVRMLRGNHGIALSFRGGHGSTRVSLVDPNRPAVLREIADGWYSLDTEAAIQAGLQRWFQQNGYVVRREVPDRDEVIATIAARCSLAHLSEASGRSTRSRDLMAHAPHSVASTFHIIEAKGRTQVETDFYDTFGQIFPIDDSSVTRGWTINKVPKHGLCLKFAQRFVKCWSLTDPTTRVALAVVVPDFPPWGHTPSEFYDGPTMFYPNQAAMYAQFLETGNVAGESVFPRLLRHLRDRYNFLNMAQANGNMVFRFWGYQGVNWVRDFASNSPVSLGLTGESTSRE